MLDFQIETDSRLPLVHQIAGQIRRYIAKGALQKGEMLPSVRELGGELGINFNTVAKAYRQLETEGLVEIRHGLGARVKDTRIDTEGSHPEMVRQLEDVICRLTLSGAKREEVIDLFAEAIGNHYAQEEA